MSSDAGPLAALDLVVEHLPIVNAALQHIDVPLVRRVVVTNRGPIELGPLSFYMEVDPPVAAPFRHELLESLRPGESLALDERVLQMPLTAAALARQLGTVLGTLRVTVQTPTHGARTETRRIEVHGFSSWCPSLHAEALACFIQPDHPALAPLVQRAQDLLLANTHDASLAPYNSAPQAEKGRARLIVKSLWDALSEAGIRYAQPRPGLDAPTVLVRAPDQVLSERTGTDLDLALFVASLAARSGLHPLLVVTPQSALVGVFLHADDHLPAPVDDDASEVIKRRDLNRVVVIEAAAVLRADTLERAEAAAIDLLGAPGPMRVLDIQQLRSAGIRPLPIRLMGDLVLLPTTPAPPTATSPPTRRAAPEPAAPRALTPAEKRLERWKSELLDTSLRNPLLAFRPGSRRSLPLLGDDIAALEDALASGEPFSLVARDDLGLRSKIQFQKRTGEALDTARVRELLAGGTIVCDLPQADWEKRVLELYRSGKSASEETGSTALWLALGFVVLDGERPLNAPIVLVPVQLSRGSPRDPFRLRLGDDEPRVNSTLLKKLSVDFHVDVSGLESLPEDDAGIDIPLVLTRFRELALAIPKCQIQARAAVGFFSFAKYLMWLDLEARSNALAQSPVVAHLLAASGQPFPLVAPFVPRQELDQRRPPMDDLSVVDADSSQLVAVQAAVDGDTFVLEGPPGTGKSQTITNIIAECLGRGLSVLFVAEKRAACQVVRRRLEQVGLGAFVLDLHAPDQTKAEIVTALAKNLDLRASSDETDLALCGADLQAARDTLAETWQRLHAPSPTGLSVWQAVARLFATGATGDAGILRHHFGTAESFDKISWSAATQAIRALGHAARAVSPMASHPFAGSALDDWDAGLQSDVGELLATARGALPGAHRDLRALSELVAVPIAAPHRAAARRLHALSRAATDAPPGTARHLAGRHHERELLPVLEAVTLRAQRRQRWEALAPRWQPAMLTDPGLDRWCRKFVTWQSAFVIFAFFALFFTRRALRPFARGPHGSRRDVARDLQQAVQVRTDDALIAERKGRVPEAFEDEAIDEIAKRLGAARRLLELRRELAPDAGVVDLEAVLTRVAERGAVALDAATRVSEASLLALDAPLDKLSATLRAPTAFAADIPFETLALTLATMDSRKTSLRDWAAWQRARNATLALGLEPFVAALESGAVTPDTLDLAFERSVLDWRIKEGVKQDPVLRRFRGVDHEELGHRFRTLDAERQTAARSEVVKRLVSRLPDGSIEAGEVGLLRAEAKKKRRHLPLRTLFAKIPGILPRLEPCILASPMSVAAYLDPALPPFDVVIFDEASQIPPWDAVGALARGRSAVVVGDSKQMPPTAFFESLGEDGPVLDDEPEELESILDECDRSGLAKLSLSWHYRSRHPSLIQFSNHRYYDGGLIAFPAADADAASLGVKWRRVEGRYVRGERTNEVEARALVAEVVARLRDPATAQKSIGIVTFAMPQQRFIQDLLDAERRADATLDPYFAADAREPVFVKNLENVQGDERDVMFFSVGFGRDAKGAVSMNLGALNRQGGERRLNVAVTRARELLIVYASIDPHEIDTAKTGALGVRHLREFLEFAERGGAVRDVEELAARGRDRAAFLDVLATRLGAAGYACDRDLAAQGPRIDLAVRDPDRPERYLLGIVTDSVAWAKFPALRDREKLGLAVLTNLGWTIERLFALDVWHDPEHEIERILTKLATLRASPPPEPTSMPPVAAVPAPMPSALAAPTTTPSWLAEAPRFQRAAVPALGAADLLEAPQAYARVAERMRAVIDEEGPIHRDEALRRTFAAWQVSRVGPKMARQAEDHLRALPNAERPTLRGDFYWPASLDPETWTAFRVVGAGPRREPEHLPVEEVANALLQLLSRTVGTTRAEAHALVGAAFGFERRGKKMDELLTKAIDLAIVRGRASESDGRLALVEGGS